MGKMTRMTINKQAFNKFSTSTLSFLGKMTRMTINKQALNKFSTSTLSSSALQIFLFGTNYTRLPFINEKVLSIIIDA